VNSRGQRVLVTGGARFIGSHLAEALLRRGARLVIVDNFDSFYASESKQANLEAIGRTGRYEFHDLAIHKFTALIETGKPVAIFGDDSSARDYTYVDDIVAGVLAALNHELRPSSGCPSYETFNLRNSHPVKLAELIELLEKVTGRKGIREWRPLEPGDSPLTWADISKASRLPGYRPTTSLEEGLTSFVKWYRAARPMSRARDVMQVNTA
jgi:nucleoside-diphosphate-sugar epimerase